MITAFLGVVSSIATALVFAGGAMFAMGYLPAAYLVTAIGAGWLAIIYSALLRMLGARD